LSRLIALEAGAPERRFTMGGSAKSVARCHRTVLAYWKFESISLQQTVRLLQDFSFLYRKAGSCRGVRGPGQAARLAETRRARQHHTNCR
jgi:hypothetical protein